MKFQLNVGQRHVLFGKVTTWLEGTYECSEEEQRTPEFFHYDSNSQIMMEKMGYKLTECKGWTLEKDEEQYFDHLFQ